LIKELLQSARAGAPVDESAIPPEVFIASQPASVPQQKPVQAPAPPQPPPPAAPQSRAVPLRQPSPPSVAPHPRAVPIPQPSVTNNPVVLRCEFV